MDGNQNNIQSPSGVSTTWIGNNPYLVTDSGIIPLTTSLSGLSLSPTSFPQTAQVSGGDFYVVSVQESPTRDPWNTESNGNSDDIDGVNTGVNQYNNENKQQQILDRHLSSGQPLQYRYISQPQAFLQAGLTQPRENTYRLPVNQPQFLTNTPQYLINHTLSTSQPQFPVSAPQFLTNNTSQPLISNSISTSQPQLPVDQSTTTGRMTGLPGQPYTATLFSGLPLQSQPSSLYDSPSLSTSYNSNSSLPSPSLSSSSISVLSDSSYNNISSTDGTSSCVFNSSDTLTSTSSVSSTPGAVSPSNTVAKNKGHSESDVFPPDDNKPMFPAVPPCYYRPLNKECCVRCEKKVYHMEKLGPVKDCLYHKLCFSCVVCATILNVKNYHVNPNDLDDINVYCITHVPNNKSVCVDAASVSIKGALKAPKLDIINHQIRGGPDAMKGNKIDGQSISVKTALNAPRPSLEGEHTKYQGHTYNLDVEMTNLLQTRNVPAINLLTSNKIQ